MAHHAPPRLVSVLLVDDDQDTLQLYSEFLRFSGLRVWTAVATSTALSSAREHHPDVVVTDISLPDNDGWTLCHLLRADAATRDCGVIALTGWEHDSQLSELSLEAGVDLELTNPGLPDALLMQIASLRWRVRLRRMRRRQASARADTRQAHAVRLEGDEAVGIHKAVKSRRSR
jgi:DNA-binding response OmpR family regulator